MRWWYRLNVGAWREMTDRDDHWYARWVAVPFVLVMANLLVGLLIFAITQAFIEAFLGDPYQREALAEFGIIVLVLTGIWAIVYVVLAWTGRR